MAGPTLCTSVARVRSKSVRGVAFAAVWALLGVSVAQAFHAAAAEHRRCPDHGELIHVQRAAAKVSDQPGVSRGAPAAHGDAHDHCEVFFTAAADAEDLHVSSESQPAIATVTFTGRAVTSDRRVLYRLAPKNSPSALSTIL